MPSKLKGINKYEQLITFVEDRAGHDIKYAIDASKIANKLKWIPNETFRTGIKKTVQWYLENQAWCKGIMHKTSQRKRLGVSSS